MGSSFPSAFERIVCALAMGAMHLIERLDKELTQQLEQKPTRLETHIIPGQIQSSRTPFLLLKVSNLRDWTPSLSAHSRTQDSACCLIGPAGAQRHQASQLFGGQGI